MIFKMQSANLCFIVKSINHYLNNGITAGTDVISFAESTLGIGTIEELARIISGPDSSDNGLLELVLSPDHEIRTTIEPHVPSEGLAPADTDAIAATVAGVLKKINVHVGAAGVAAVVDLSLSIIRGFVNKLNLSKSLPFHSRDDFPDYLTDETVIALRVLVRNSRYRPGSGHDRVIISLIDGLGRLAVGGDTGLILDCLSLLIGLFNGNRADFDIHAMLSAEKKRYEDILHKAYQFSDYCARYTMEFLMAHKVQPPAADTGEIRRRLYLLDLISMAVFDRPANGSPRELTLRFDRNGDCLPE
jgi:hypothetical protein